MPVAPDLFDRAFDVWQAFGPERGRPAEDRWAEALPDLDPADYAAVAERIRAIERRALDAAYQAAGGPANEAAARRQLRDAFPDLTDDRHGRLWSQARYFAMK